MSKDGRIWLSHTGIESLNRCPRCFWLQYKRGIRQPEGIVSRLANRFDIILKDYFDRFREKGILPPLISDKLEGSLQNPFQEKYFARINDLFGFFGKLDECLVNDNGEYIPVDFKTSSSDPRQKNTLSAYQSQIDDYIFLLSKDGKKTSGYGYLVYIYPDTGDNLEKTFPMIIHVTRLTGQPENTKKRIENAINVLNGNLPKPSDNCPFCSWYNNIRTEIDRHHVSGEKIITPVREKEIKGIPINSKTSQTSLMDLPF